MPYIRTFLYTTPLFTTLYWWAAHDRPRPLPLWPDAFVIGSVAGLFACLAVFQWQHTRHFWGIIPRVVRIVRAHRADRRG